VCVCVCVYIVYREQNTSFLPSNATSTHSPTPHMAKSHTLPTHLPGLALPGRLRRRRRWTAVTCVVCASRCALFLPDTIEQNFDNIEECGLDEVMGVVALAKLHCSDVTTVYRAPMSRRRRRRVFWGWSGGQAHPGVHTSLSTLLNLWGTASCSKGSYVTTHPITTLTTAIVKHISRLPTCWCTGSGCVTFEVNSTTTPGQTPFP
jgi:hypothetical protein